MPGIRGDVDEHPAKSNARIMLAWLGLYDPSRGWTYKAG